jgi:hypothetical protein
MKLVRAFLFAVTCAALLAPAAFAQAVKASDPAAKLPAPILTAFRTSYPNATIKNVAKETEGGKTVWEVESIDNNLTRDIVYNPDGTIVDMEEECAIASLPAAVTDAVKAKYPKATITKAEKTTAGQRSWFELTLKGAAVTSIELTPDGKPVPAAKEGKGERGEKEDAPRKK